MSGWGGVLVALIGVLGTLGGGLGGVWLSNRSAERRLAGERAERARDQRGSQYAEFHRAAGAFRSAGNAELAKALTAVRQIAVHLDLLAPPEIRTACSAVLDAGDRLVRTRAAHSIQSVAGTEATTEYDAAVAKALSAMRADLGTDPAS